MLLYIPVGPGLGTAHMLSPWRQHLYVSRCIHTLPVRQDNVDTLCDAAMKAAGYDTTRTVVLIDSRLLMARALHECCHSHHRTRRGHHHGHH